MTDADAVRLLAAWLDAIQSGGREEDIPPLGDQLVPHGYWHDEDDPALWAVDEEVQQFCPGVVRRADPGDRLVHAEVRGGVTYRLWHQGPFRCPRCHGWAFGADPTAGTKWCNSNAEGRPPSLSGRPCRGE